MFEKIVNVIELPPYPIYIKHALDIISFEGPLLTGIIDNRNRIFLKHWCDCSTNSNRWLLFETTNNLVLQFQNKNITLRKLMDTSCIGKTIYMLEDEKLFLITYNDLPESYLPVKS